jgi:Ser/Thr protein kinase RdoA (MazF antagonist)
LSRYLNRRPALDCDANTRADAGVALELLAPFHDELRPLLPQLSPLWTHNDPHASNFLWNGSGADVRTAVIIDFGLADRTNAVHDLAHAIERNIVEWLALLANPKADEIPVHFDHLAALLEGYESVRPLTETERRTLSPMLALCHAEFALSEADYFLGVLHSREKAQMASRGYLVGHARWFHTRTGSQLLAWLRQYAATPTADESGSRG